jgi:Xaa-Pro aminopeptidase
MTTVDTPSTSTGSRPAFDAGKLDALLEEAGIDALAATSRHNVRYLLGTYSLFFEHFDAVADDRYLPALGYVRGRLDQGFLACSPLDVHHFSNVEPWTPSLVASGTTSVDTAAAVARLLGERGVETATIGIEDAFVPLRFHRELTRALPHATLVDVSPILEELRAVKRPDELELLRVVSERIVDAMAATMHATAPNTTTREIHDRLASEEVARGLGFEYCLLTAGTSLNRAPSTATWDPGGILSLDSGGTLHGYLGDLTRMAVLGEPTPRMREVLAEVQAVQQTARAVVRAGVLGGEVYEAAMATVADLPDAPHTAFVAHGIGLVTHESPRVIAGGPIPYDPEHAERPLEAGMVLSIETDMKAVDVGFVKLEDTIAVTADGYEAYGDGCREWTVVPC